VCRGRHSVQNALPLVVDADGVAKACTCDFLTVNAALRILELVRLPVSRVEGSRLMVHSSVFWADKLQRRRGYAGQSTHCCI
jgi:hypothetical protein